MHKNKIYTTSALYFSNKLKSKLEAILDFPVTIIEAPMGYGKTTAIKEYLKNSSIETYWQNINDNSITFFWKGFCNMVTKLDSAVGDSLIKMDFPEDIILLDEAISLINRIKLKNKIAIVIEDYHLITCELVDKFFSFLFKNLDENIHIIISTRIAIFSNLQELKLKNYINHITKDSLELSVKDIEKYYKLCGFTFCQEELNQLYDYSEGWISALYLFILNFVEYKRFDLTNSIYQLVINAVYNPLNEKLKDFLYYICIFDFLDLKQVQYMYGDDAENLLNELMQNNDFISYDYINQQYHLHNIFSKCIMDLFNKKDIEFKKKIYNRAGLWFYQNNEYILAMEYFYKTKNFDNLLDTLIKDRGISLSIEYKEHLLKYINECPPEFKKNNHLAMLVYLSKLIAYNETELFSKVYEKVLRDIEEDNVLDDKERNQLLGECKILLSFITYNDINKMMILYKEASELMYKSSSIWVNDGNWTFGSPSVLYLIYRDKGALWEEVEIIKKISPCYYKITGGRGRGAEYMMEAEAYFNMGDIENSEISMHKALSLAGEDLNSGIYICAMFLHVRILFLRGLYEESISLLKSLREKMSSNQLHLFIHTMDLCEAYIYSCVKKTNFIPAWIMDGKLENTKLLFPTVPFLNMVYCRILLIQGQYAKLIGFSEKALELVSTFSNQLCYIYIHIHVSAALDKLYKREEALSQLKLSLDLADGDMLYMPFVENCDYIYPLLEILNMRGFYKNTIKNIFTLYDKYKLSLQKASSNKNENENELSKREYEVAKLASKGLTNKEISEQLFISVNTVKAALKAIFKKLSVKSRVQLEKIFQEMP